MPPTRNIFPRWQTAVDRLFAESRRVFPVMIGMEMLDHDACARVAEKLGGAPVFAPDNFDMYQLVSILRACDRILSSRYHAIVTSMPAGVPSAGVTMDERIRNLMRERGHEHLLMRWMNRTWRRKSSALCRP